MFLLSLLSLSLSNYHHQVKRHSSDDKSNISNGQKLRSEGEIGVLGMGRGAS